MFVGTQLQAEPMIATTPVIEIPDLEVEGCRHATECRRAAIDTQTIEVIAARLHRNAARQEERPRQILRVTSDVHRELVPWLRIQRERRQHQRA